MGAVTSHSKVGRRDLPDLVTFEPGSDYVNSLSDRAYYLLRERIVTLDIAPGATIDERALQNELELGRTPIREALHRLAREKLIVVAPYRGMFASSIDLADLRAVNEVRVELEGHAAFLASGRVEDKDAGEIENLISALNARRECAAARELMQLDHQTHALIHRAARNAYLLSTLREYYIHSLRMWFLVLDRMRHIEDAVSEHVELLIAIHDGQARLARRLMRAHVADFEKRLRAVM
ncbi:MAG TPA: GntR family transcriptional regulator [Candidatus Stackebrandtia faecavium]|nr:GntR family transcriptional regulator [Candidatus Stackebrandtia faecavium]